MRFLLKILFAPILAALAVVTWFLVFVVSLSSGILCIPAAILGFFGLFIIFVDSVSYGAGLLVIAFLISPYGLPMLAGLISAVRPRSAFSAPGSVRPSCAQPTQDSNSTDVRSIAAIRFIASPYCSRITGGCQLSSAVISGT